MHRGERFPHWFLLLVAVFGFLSGCLSMRDLKPFASRQHLTLV
jgi:hypothetical protein